MRINISRTIAFAIGAILLSSIVTFAQSSSQDGAKKFFKDITGEWIGVCEQSTDGQQAENKYFHAIVKETSPNTFLCSFDYYRIDKDTGAPLPIGKSEVTTTIADDGTVTNKITGSGTVMVNKEPKDQKHELQEVLSSSKSNSLQGSGKGTISVSGMPLGLGKNGKILNASSNWSLDKDTLVIDQSLKVGFKALFVTKKFDIAAHYTARRGTSVASLMPSKGRAVGAPVGGSSHK